MHRFILYPNPLQTTLFIRSNDETSPKLALHLRLYDASGRLTAHYILGLHRLFWHFPLEKLPSGLYFYQIMGADGAVLQRGEVVRG